MLVDEIKRRVMVALKAGNTVEKEVLRVVLGEVQTVAARGGAENDEATAAVVRKLIKSNEETLAAATVDQQKADLTQELVVLRSLLPRNLDVGEIVALLAPVRDALRAAGNDGQATGIAMKHIKAAGAVVNGKDVSEAVRTVRS